MAWGPNLAPGYSGENAIPTAAQAGLDDTTCFFNAVRARVRSGVLLPIHPFETRRGAPLISPSWYANVMEASNKI